MMQITPPLKITVSSSLKLLQISLTNNDNTIRLGKIKTQRMSKNLLEFIIAEKIAVPDHEAAKHLNSAN